MPLSTVIIDGHNLIGKLPGFSLSELDDEKRLVEMLQVYARVRRKHIEVYFDGAPAGRSGARAVGVIQVVFVPLGKPADAAIRERLFALGKQARNMSVVTSDRQVQTEAKSRGATVIPSENFARELFLAANETTSAQKPARSDRAASRNRRPPEELGPSVPDHEVQEWLKIFGEDKTRKKKP